MKPKLLILTTTFPRWKNDPDPPFVYDLARRLTSSFDVTVHTPHYRGAETSEILDDMQIFRFRYFLGSFEKLAGNTGILPTIRNNKLYLFLVPFLIIAQISSLVFLLFRYKPDVIHAHWVLPQGSAAAIAHCLFGIPFIVTAHGSDIFSLQGKIFQWLKCIALRKAKCITAVSKSLAITMQNSCNINVDKISVIPMGVSADLFKPGVGNLRIQKQYKIIGPFLLYVGRLSEVKGVSYLIDAMPTVLSIFPDTCLLIVGHGELTDTLNEQVKNMQLEQRVYFTGPVSNNDLPEYYASADIFIGPSIYTEAGEVEGFGLTFVEAAMSGCLLIGSDVGGIGDIIEDGKTGFLVPEKDSKAIAERILYALHNYSELEPLIKQARQKCIDNFDLEVISKQYENLLQGLVT